MKKIFLMLLPFVKFLHQIRSRRQPFEDVNSSKKQSKDARCRLAHLDSVNMKASAVRTVMCKENSQVMSDGY